MATRYGRTFTTRRGRRGRYKYVNGRKVSFEASRKVSNFKRGSKSNGWSVRRTPSSRRKYWGAKTYARKQRSFTRRLRGY